MSHFVSLMRCEAFFEKYSIFNDNEKKLIVDFVNLYTNPLVCKITRTVKEFLRDMTICLKREGSLNIQVKSLLLDGRCQLLRLDLTEECINEGKAILGERLKQLIEFYSTRGGAISPSYSQDTTRGISGYDEFLPGMTFPEGFDKLEMRFIELKINQDRKAAALELSTKPYNFQYSKLGACLKLFFDLKSFEVGLEDWDLRDHIKAHLADLEKYFFIEIDALLISFSNPKNGIELWQIKKLLELLPEELSIDDRVKIRKRDLILYPIFAFYKEEDKKYQKMIMENALRVFMDMVGETYGEKEGVLKQKREIEALCVIDMKYPPKNILEYALELKQYAIVLAIIDTHFLCFYTPNEIKSLKTIIGLDGDCDLYRNRVVQKLECYVL